MNKTTKVGFNVFACCLSAMLILDTVIGGAIPSAVSMWFTKTDREALVGRVLRDESALDVALTISSDNRRVAGPSVPAPSEIVTVEELARETAASIPDVPPTDVDTMDDVADEITQKIAQEPVVPEEAKNTPDTTASTTTEPEEVKIAPEIEVAEVKGGVAAASSTVESNTAASSTAVLDTVALNIDIKEPQTVSIDADTPKELEKVKAEPVSKGVEDIPVVAISEVEEVDAPAENARIVSDKYHFSADNLRDQPPIALSDYQGKVVLVGFWVSWCSPCKHMLPWLDELKSDFSDENFEIIGLSLDSERSDALTFMEDLEREGRDLNYPLAQHGSGFIAEQYGVEALPSMYLLDENHNLVSVSRGYNTNSETAVRQQIDLIFRGRQDKQSLSRAAEE